MAIRNGASAHTEACMHAISSCSGLPTDLESVVSVTPSPATHCHALPFALSPSDLDAVSRVVSYLIQQSNLECGIVVQEDAQRAGWRGAVQGDLAHAQVGAYGVHCCGRRCLHMHHPSLCFPSAAACLDTRLNIERVLMSAMTLTCQIDGLTLRGCGGLQRTCQVSGI